MRPVPDRSPVPSLARVAVARVAVARVAVARVVAGGTLLVLSASPLWAQAKRPMAWVDAQRLRSVAGTAISPDGNQMLYVLTTPDWKEATTQSDLYVVRTDRGLESTRQLTFTTGKNESSPRWAPAGGWFVFSSNREGAAGDTKQQLFMMRGDGGEARRITNAKEGVSTFAFSKDGQWLVYRSGKANEEQLYALAMGSLDRGTQVDSLTPTQLTKHPTGVGSWELTPDSRRIYFITADTVDADEKARVENKFTVDVRNASTSVNSLWMIDLSTPARATSRVTRDTSIAVTAFSIAPDNRWVGFTAVPNDRYKRNITEQGIYADQFLLDTRDGSIERLTKNDESSESGFSFSPDSRTSHAMRSVRIGSGAASETAMRSFHLAISRSAKSDPWVGTPRNSSPAARQSKVCRVAKVEVKLAGRVPRSAAAW